MKILRHLVTVLFAAFIITSCEKSSVTPRHCGDKSEKQQTENAVPAGMIQSSENTADNVSARSSIIVDGENASQNESAKTDEDPDSHDVSGSGDDDRDGGERKRKR